MFKLVSLLVVVFLLFVPTGVLAQEGTFGSPLPTPEPPDPPILPETGIESLVRQIGAWLEELWSLGGVKALVAQIGLNVILAVAAAIKTDSFDLSKIGEFLYRKVAPYLLVYVAAKALGLSAGVEWLAPATYAVLAATLLGDLLENVENLGIELPSVVQYLLG